MQASLVFGFAQFRGPTSCHDNLSFVEVFLEPKPSFAIAKEDGWKKCSKKQKEMREMLSFKITKIRYHIVPAHVKVVV